MQIWESDFFSQFICWVEPGFATPELKGLRDVFDRPEFDAQRDAMHYLGNEPIDVSSLPTLELPDTVLFPDESVTLAVSQTDPLLRTIEQGGAVVRLGNVPPATVVKFRARSSQPREDDGLPGAVCTLGTVYVNARYGPGEARLYVLAYARLISDQDQEDPPVRNPAYSVFGVCADFPELRENFVKLIHQSPGIDGVPGSNLLDRLEAIEQVGREYHGWCENRYYALLDRGEDVEDETWEQPLLFLDVAADFIAVSLLRQIPGLEVPFRLQQEWVDLLDPCARVRALNAFVVEALDDLMTPDRIYARALQAKIERYVAGDVERPVLALDLLRRDDLGPVLHVPETPHPPDNLFGMRRVEEVLRPALAEQARRVDHDHLPPSAASLRAA